MRMFRIGDGCFFRINAKLVSCTHIANFAAAELLANRKETFKISYV